jgi:4-hydroxy-tetrahydrodipicolinate reductase
MGQMLYQTIKESDEFEMVFGVDKNIKGPIDVVTLFDDTFNVSQNPDVIIDFSNRSSTSSLLGLATNLKVPLVICSTGQTTEDLVEIHKAAKSIPILLSYNTAIGATYLTNISTLGAKLFGDKNYKINITETHNAHKKDAPSGTAIAILNAVLSAQPSLQPIYSPPDITSNSNQINVTSKRIGDVIGEHEISFSGNGETLTVKHEITDRKLFALGALECAKFIKSKPPGLYRMSDMIKLEKTCCGGGGCSNKKNSTSSPEKAD